MNNAHLHNLQWLFSNWFAGQIIAMSRTATLARYTALIVAKSWINRQPKEWWIARARTPYKAMLAEAIEATKGVKDTALVDLMKGRFSRNVDPLSYSKRGRKRPKTYGGKDKLESYGEANARVNLYADGRGNRPR